MPRRPLPPAPSTDSLLQRALKASATGILIMVIMVCGSLVLWGGVPLAWLWIGGRVEAASSIGVAIGVMMFGAAASIIALASILVWLNHQLQELKAARGQEPGVNVLEVVLVVTAGIAAVGFGFWFLIISGPGPTLSPAN